ncbi:MAG: hypothetical protein A2157_06590 [Deltaproteobacteria bacterium RBG_16_47_11]|nr:MAG: hypothetical protein A2157_06590 [Deltaproteobacteria bacterium RBG_16_47_11]
MSIIKKLFGSSRTDFTKEACNLLPSAKIFATTSYSTVAKEFQGICAVDLARWDFVLTIGGVFVAISQLNHEDLAESTKNSLLDIIIDAVVTWQPDAPEAVEDCRRFVDRTYEGLATLPESKTNAQFLFSDALGSWIVWNLFRRAPSTPEERQLIRVLGGMLIHSFMYW